MCISIVIFIVTGMNFMPMGYSDKFDMLERYILQNNLIKILWGAQEVNTNVLILYWSSKLELQKKFTKWHLTGTERDKNRRNIFSLL